jgi:hypothetical protein
MGAFYWERYPDGPFATLIAVAATYCSPDACDGDYEDLISRARKPDGCGSFGVRVRRRVCTGLALCRGRAAGVRG